MPLKADGALRKDQTNAYSLMEHRHFATVAAILKGCKPHGVRRNELDEWRRIVIAFADDLRLTNPKFDRQRFLAACNAVLD
jgi:hypothetical protein